MPIDRIAKSNTNSVYMPQKNMQTTLRYSHAFTMVAFALAAFGPFEKATAYENPPPNFQQAVEKGTIHGQIVLPSEVPEWFQGGELLLENAEVVIEGMYRGPRMNRPENYGEMSKEERIAWSEQYRKTDEYREYERKSREAYENRPFMKFPVDSDGSFTVKGLRLARYNVIPVLPHPAAKGKELASQSFGSGFKQVVLSEERPSINVGKMELKLKNVVMPGDVAPAWTAKNYDGAELTSSDFQGKYLLVDFWATWCTPCIAEIPNLERVFDDFGGDQFQILGLSIDDKLELPSEFLKKRPTTYLQAYLGSWKEGETTTTAFGVTSVPSIWLIGPDGRVIARDLRGEKLSDTVRAALKASVVPK